MLETTKYVRKPFHIDAVQVTASNLAAVAEWTGGEIRNASGTAYVKVPVNRPMNERQTKAYINDWVLFAGKGFKVYTPKAFDSSFEQVSVETTMHYGPAPVVADQVSTSSSYVVGQDVTPTEQYPTTTVTETEEGILVDGEKPVLKTRTRKPSTVVESDA